MNVKYNNENNMNADAYGNNSSGFRIKSGMTNMESGRSTPNLFPSGPTRGSIIAQSGRSMVEMLGTLAIIGVLSIGGIAGYSYGMDKYRANQTVNDVMLRAVDVMTQLSQGKDPDLEPEWGTKGTVYNMEEIRDETNNTWGIVVDGVPSRVCQMVGDALKTQATIYVGNAERNDTTASDPCESSEENTMEFYFETLTTFGECKTDTDCGTDKYCDFGLCFDGVRPEMTGRVFDSACTSDAECNTGWTGNCSSCDTNLGYCVEKYDMNNEACTLSDGTTGKCGAGECLPTGCTYDTNKCEGKTYCASPNTSCTEAFQSGESGSCVAFNARFSPLTIDGTTYYVSNGPLSWWDAVSACESVDKSLLSVEDIVVRNDDDTTGYLSNSHTKTALGEALYDKGWGSIGYPWIWSSILYNSCGAYNVSLYDGGVSNASRNFNHGYYAVCR